MYSAAYKINLKKTGTELTVSASTGTRGTCQKQKTKFETRKIL